MWCETMERFQLQGLARESECHQAICSDSLLLIYELCFCCEVHVEHAVSGMD